MIHVGVNGQRTDPQVGGAIEPKAKHVVAKETFVVTITAKKPPLYNLPADSQMYFTPSGRLFVVYDDDHDEDPSALHDVTDQYDVKVEKK